MTRAALILRLASALLLGIPATSVIAGDAQWTLERDSSVANAEVGDGVVEGTRRTPESEAPFSGVRIDEAP